MFLISTFNSSLCSLSFLLPVEAMITNLTAPLVENGTVSLICEATGFPLPNIMWARDEDMLVDGFQENLVIDTTNFTANRSVSSMLLLENGRAGDSGEYSCIASNGVGHNSSVKINITVESTCLWRERAGCRGERIWCLYISQNVHS